MIKAGEMTADEELGDLPTFDTSVDASVDVSDYINKELEVCVDLNNEHGQAGQAAPPLCSTGPVPGRRSARACARSDADGRFRLQPWAAGRDIASVLRRRSRRYARHHTL